MQQSVANLDAVFRVENLRSDHFGFTFVIQEKECILHRALYSQYNQKYEDMEIHYNRHLKGKYATA